MPIYEYKVVPAPGKGTKAKGVKTAEGRFALSVEAELNRLAAGGWEYLRAELLPSEERSGLTGSVTTWRNVLVFRRAKGGAAGGVAETSNAGSAFAAASDPLRETETPEAHIPVGPARRDAPESAATPPVKLEPLGDTAESSTRDTPLTGIEKVVRRNSESKGDSKE